MAVQSAYESEGDLAGAAPGCVRSRESAGCDVGLGSPRATGRPAARGDQQAEEIGGTPWVDRFAASGFVRGGRSGSARTGGGVAILLSQPGMRACGGSRGAGRVQTARATDDGCGGQTVRGARTGLEGMRHGQRTRYESEFCDGEISVRAAGIF